MSFQASKRSLLVLAMLFSGLQNSVMAADEADPAVPEPAETLSKVPGEMDGVEEIFAKETAGKDPGPVIDDRETRKKSADKVIETPAPTKSTVGDPRNDIRSVSDLVNLAPFDNVAILQKRYLPKTQRFELYGALNAILNDKFFTIFGANGRFSYNFNERYAIEAIGIFSADTEKSVTRDLREIRGVQTTNFVAPVTYYGVDLKWTPIYGKMSFLNKKITPFDLYFAAGVGMTNTNQGRAENTIHFGTGQLFAINKSMAFRWDFSWNFYNARSTVPGSTLNGVYNNLFISAGASFYFPEATYR